MFSKNRKQKLSRLHRLLVGKVRKMGMRNEGKGYTLLIGENVLNFKKILLIQLELISWFIFSWFSSLEADVPVVDCNTRPVTLY